MKLLIGLLLATLTVLCGLIGYEQRMKRIRPETVGDRDLTDWLLLGLLLIVGFGFGALVVYVFL